MVRRNIRPVLFITGTDTSVGKTRVARALIAAWRAAGRRISAFKPIETGCDFDGERLVPVDGARLAAACGVALDLVCPVRFATAASPEAAAAAEGRGVDLAIIDRAFAALPSEAELVVVEGAGGLLVPITPKTTMADLAAHLDARLLIVARDSLGTVNHTLLTVEAARRRGLPVAGVVLNRISSAVGADGPSNAAAIAAHGAVAVLGTLPHLPGDPDDAELAAHGRAHLDLAALWSQLTASDRS